MIYNKDYFVKGELADAVLIIDENDNTGNIVDTRSFIGENEGDYRLTLAWDSGRETKHFNTFKSAMVASRGYWAKQAIWHFVDGTRKRVVRWQ